MFVKTPNVTTLNKWFPVISYIYDFDEDTLTFDTIVFLALLFQLLYNFYITIIGNDLHSFNEENNYVYNII